ncbi:hypothetical protein TREES_T100008577 [Tupaia chinensis]|uniref:Uncharacterized protein n=1 Tax=Tupaia chinensis TaxID=246437 RepID=L9L4F9_TUPCH|nr:hypothetical protein TREES_T100008577 [Tupaia chinensis]
MTLSWWADLQFPSPFLVWLGRLKVKYQVQKSTKHWAEMEPPSVSSCQPPSRACGGPLSSPAGCAAPLLLTSPSPSAFCLLLTPTQLTGRVVVLPDPRPAPLSLSSDRKKRLALNFPVCNSSSFTVMSELHLRMGGAQSSSQGRWPIHTGFTCTTGKCPGPAARPHLPPQLVRLARLQFSFLDTDGNWGSGRTEALASGNFAPSCRSRRRSSLSTERWRPLLEQGGRAGRIPSPTFPLCPPEGLQGP